MGLFDIPGVTQLGKYISGIGNVSTPDQDARLADMERLRKFEESLAEQQAAQAGASSLQADQRDYIGRLRALSEGRGPSLAQEQMRQSTDRVTNQQYAMAAGARGNPALAQRQAMNQAGALQSAAAGQSAQARAMEQLGALSQMGGAIGQGRGQDETLNMFNAGQTNATTSANDALRLRAILGRKEFRDAYDQTPTYWEKLAGWMSGGLSGGSGQGGGQGGGGGGGGGLGALLGLGG